MVTSLIELKYPTGPLSYSKALIVSKIYGTLTNFSWNGIFLSYGSQQPTERNSATPLRIDFVMQLPTRANMSSRFKIIIMNSKNDEQQTSNLNFDSQAYIAVDNNQIGPWSMLRSPMRF